jgi:FkbM family methyltransferase
LKVLEYAINVLRPINFRGKLGLLDPLVPRIGERAAKIFGQEVKLDLAELIQRHIYLGVFEPEETALVRNLLRPGMTVVDVGANVGYYTALAASRVGKQGRVFSLEPSPYACERLRTMVEVNGLTNVQVCPVALGERAGELPLYLGSHKNHSPTLVAHEGVAPAALVPVRTFDECLDEWCLDYVDLLKLDVEGWEPKVFSGASGALRARRIHAVLCELNDHWLRRNGSSASALWQMLLGAGFVDFEASDSVPNLSEGCLTNRLFVLPCRC